MGAPSGLVGCLREEVTHRSKRFPSDARQAPFDGDRRRNPFVAVVLGVKNNDGVRWSFSDVDMPLVVPTLGRHKRDVEACFFAEFPLCARLNGLTRLPSARRRSPGPIALEI